MCMCATKLTVLDHMSGFASLEGAHLQKRWAAAGRVVMAALVLGNAVGLASISASAAAYFYIQCSAYHTRSNCRIICQQHQSSRRVPFIKSRVAELQRGSDLASLQRFSELAVLLLMVLAFVTVGAACARLLISRSGGLDAGYDAVVATVGRPLRLQVLCTTGFVFVTFLLRSVFAMMYSIAYDICAAECSPGPLPRAE